MIGATQQIRLGSTEEVPMSPKQSTKKPAKRTKDKSANGFTAEERAAMRERVKELKAEARAEKDRAAGEKDVLAKIAQMKGSDRTMAKRVHEIVTETAPNLVPRTWYGMPAYTKDGKVVVFFKDAAKFKSRYATLGFEESANLDEGAMWPTSFALTKLTGAEEKKIVSLVKKAVS
jgi:uncharacterized protein YdhG (YjbR/CyaY superfamily)